MPPGKALRQLFYLRADYLARGPNQPARPVQIMARLILVMALLFCLAFLLTRLFAAI